MFTLSDTDTDNETYKMVKPMASVILSRHRPLYNSTKAILIGLAVCFGLSLGLAQCEHKDPFTVRASVTGHR